MGPLRQRFGHLHAQTVKIEIIAVAIRLEKLSSKGTGLLPHGDGLHGQDIGGAALWGEIPIEISNAIFVAGALSGEIEATKFRT